jgi:ribosomal protein S18 acetylase RimI-like enzyme
VTRAIRLQPDDAERYMRLRRRMLDDAPWAYMATPEDDRALDPEKVRAMLAEVESALLAVPSDDGGELIAVAGIARGAPPKFGHRATLWGVFCAPEARGLGLGRAVVSAAIDVARAWPSVDWIDLGVSARSSEAQRLYESMEFQAWGREPEATQIGDQRYDEIFMAFRLNARR